MKSQVLLIRADAGGELGTGHVMRMLALAQAWMAQGGRVVIALLSCPEALVDRLQNEKIEVLRLKGCQRGSEDDGKKLIQIARNADANWIVLDGYDFGLDYQRQIKKEELKLMVMDDYGHCKTWCADLILNQNLAAEAFHYDNEILEAKILLGPKYVLLRKEFWDIKPKKHAEEPIENLLITLGGVDAENVTRMVLEAIEDAAPHCLKIHVILGPGNLHLEELESRSKSSRHHITFLQNVSDMPAEYSWADGVISAGGSTCYEWIRFALSGAVVLIADNQKPIYTNLTQSCRAVGLGNLIKQTERIKTDLLKGWLLQEAIPKPNTSIEIDGAGEHRVCSYMCQTPVYLRQATSFDMRDFYDLSSDKTVRKWSLNTESFSWEEHINWFENKLHDPKSIFLTACKTGTDEFVGYVRFENNQKNEWVVSYALHADFRGMGLGSMVIKNGIHLMISMIPEALIFKGSIHKNNSPSLRIFSSLGFIKIKDLKSPEDFDSYKLQTT